MKVLTLMLRLLTSVTGSEMSTPPSPRLLVPHSRVAVVVDPTLPDNGIPDVAGVIRVTQALYATYRDEADFVFLVANNKTRPEGVPFGEYTPVRNDTLGLEVFDDSAFFGADRTAQGVVRLAYRRAVVSRPSLHELAHRWGNWMVDGGEPTHFGFSSAGSQLGGFDARTLESLGGGQYRAANGLPGESTFGLVANRGNRAPFSLLELYLMGLVDPGDVPDIIVAQGARWVDETSGAFAASAVQTVSLASMIERVGPRVPNVKSSQKVFRVLGVVLSKTPPTSEQVAEVEAGLAGEHS
ncbi:hypothetical protein [Deinococcus hohokamensis]|uniref:Uncharacterized protein n=1 Tax=Deinococcus hohokamensis TaxID=309883 RepID=A0ABV9I840_9DEIO